MRAGARFINTRAGKGGREEDVAQAEVGGGSSIPGREEKGGQEGHTL